MHTKGTGLHLYDQMFLYLSFASPSILKVNRSVVVMIHGVGRKRPCLIVSSIVMFATQKLRKFTETSVGMSGIANNFSWTLSVDVKLGVYTMRLVDFEDCSPGKLHGHSLRTAFRESNGNVYFVSFKYRQWTQNSRWNRTNESLKLSTGNVLRLQKCTYLY